MARILYQRSGAIAVLLCLPGLVQAQARSGFGSASSGIGMGQSGFGSSFGGSGFGSSAFGAGSSLGNRGFGASTFGSGGLGGTGSFGGASSMAMGAGGGFGSGGMGGGMMGGGQGGQNFVGRSSSDFGSALNQMNRNGQQFMQQFGQMMNRGRGSRGSRGRSQQENVLPPVLVQLDIAFDHTPTAPPVVAANVRARLDRILTDKNVSPPEVTVVGDTVILRGVAKNESQRMVIERLVAMEPGVTTVENQMTVAPAPTSETLPAIGNSP